MGTSQASPRIPDPRERTARRACAPRHAVRTGRRVTASRAARAAVAICAAPLGGPWPSPPPLRSISVISLTGHAAGAMLPEDSGQLKLNTSRQVTADNTNLSAFGPRSEKFGIKPYVAYGLTNRLTMGLGSETQLIRSGLESDRAVRTDGVMNTELFLRGRLRDQDWYTISVQDILRLPGQDTAPGLTQADSSLRVQYGRSGRIGGGSWTSAVKGGFHPGLNHAPDKLQTDLVLGWQPADRWQLSAQSINTVALDGGGAAGPVPSGIDSSKGQLSVTRNLTKSLSLQVGGWQTVSGGSGAPHGYDAIVWLRY